MAIPLNPKLLESADKVLKGLTKDPMGPRPCKKCGEIYFSPSPMVTSTVDQSLPGRPDYSDLDDVCLTCLDKELKQK